VELVQRLLLATRQLERQRRHRTRGTTRRGRNSATTATRPPGRVTVERDYCPAWDSICAEIDTVAVGTGIERALDLGGATEAWLGFGVPAPQPQRDRGVVALELSGDGGQTWSAPLSTAEDNVDGYYWFDVTPWASAQTRACASA
jgi:hypothetical protein